MLFATKNNYGIYSSKVGLADENTQDDDDDDLQMLSGWHIDKTSKQMMSTDCFVAQLSVLSLMIDQQVYNQHHSNYNEVVS